MSKSKRGRPPKSEADKKGVQLSIRMSTRLREELEQARRKNAASLNEEIGQRLELSFELSKRFGSPGTYSFCRLVAEGIQLIEHNCSRGEETWLRNRFIFDQVTSLIDVMLDHFKPKGGRAKPKHLNKQFAENVGKQIALYLLQGLQITNPEIHRTTRFTHRASSLRPFLKGSPASEQLRSLEKQLPRDLRQSFREQIALFKEPNGDDK
jgi:hypothetical protein